MAINTSKNLVSKMENNKKFTLSIFVIFSGFGRNFWLRKRLQRDFITLNGVYIYKNLQFTMICLLVFKLCSMETPRYSQTPHFQLELSVFIGLVFGASTGLFAHTLTLYPTPYPPARFRLHHTFLLKILQGLIMAIRCL